MNGFNDRDHKTYLTRQRRRSVNQVNGSAFPSLWSNFQGCFLDIGLFDAGPQGRNPPYGVDMIQNLPSDNQFLCVPLLSPPLTQLPQLSQRVCCAQHGTQMALRQSRAIIVIALRGPREKYRGPITQECLEFVSNLQYCILSRHTLKEFDKET